MRKNDCRKSTKNHQIHKITNTVKQGELAKHCKHTFLRNRNRTSENVNRAMRFSEFRSHIGHKNVRELPEGLPIEAWAGQKLSICLFGQVGVIVNVIRMDDQVFFDSLTLSEEQTQTTSSEFGTFGFETHLVVRTPSGCVVKSFDAKINRYFVSIVFPTRRFAVP